MLTENEVPALNGSPPAYSGRERAGEACASLQWAVARNFNVEVQLEEAISALGLKTLPLDCHLQDDFPLSPKPEVMTS